MDDLTRQQMYQYWVNKGFSPAQASGILGNKFAESGYNPSAFNPAGGGDGAYGMFQWRNPGGRLPGLREFAAKRGAGSDDALTQMDYAWHELQSTEAAAYDALLKANTPAEAADIFRRTFERPGEDPSGYRRARQEAARVYNAYSGREPVEVPIGYGNNVPQTTDPRVQSPFTFGSDISAADPRTIDPRTVDPSELAMGQPTTVNIDTTPAGLAAMREMQQASLVDPMYSQMGPLVPMSPSVGDVGPLPSPVNLVDTPTSPMAPMEPALNLSPMELSFGLPTAVNAGEAVNAPFTFPNGQPASILDMTDEETNDLARQAASNPASNPIVRSAASNAITTEQDSEEEAEEKAARRRRLGQALMQLGVGLGQMSRGLPVDTMGVVQHYDNMELLEQQMAAEQAETARVASEANMGMAGSADFFANAGMMDLAQGAMAGVPVEDLMKEYRARTSDIRSDDQSLTSFERQLTRDELAAEREFRNQYDLNLQEAGIDLSSEERNRAFEAEQGMLLNTALDPSSTPEQVAAVTANMSPATRKTLSDVQSQPAVMQQAQSLVDNNLASNVGEAVMQLRAASRPTTTIDTVGNLQLRENFNNYSTFTEANDPIRRAASRSNALLQGMEDITLNQLDREGLDTGLLTPLLKDAFSVLRSVGLGNFVDETAEQLGVSSNELSTLEQGQLALAYAIAQANKGQGSITENERAQMLRQVPNLLQSEAGRFELIHRTRAFNDLDIRYYDYIRENISDDRSNFEQVRLQADKLISDASSAVVRARVNYAKSISDSYSTGAVADPNLKDILPNITEEQARALNLTEYWDTNKDQFVSLR